MSAKNVTGKWGMGKSLLIDDSYAVHHVAYANLSHDIQAFGHPAKDRVFSVQKRGRRKRDVKLRACAVRLGSPRHGHRAGVAVRQIRSDFERNVLARASSACAVWATALDDKVGFNAMEFQPVVEISLGEFYEVCGCDRREVFVKSEFDRAFVGFNYC